MDYIIYCDESTNKGRLYSDFFGGCILDFADLKEISDALNKRKAELNLYQEVKWIKVTSNYLEKCQDLIHLFFDYVRDGRIRFRVMFRETGFSTADESRDKYF